MSEPWFEIDCGPKVVALQTTVTLSPLPMVHLTWACMLATMRLLFLETTNILLAGLVVASTFLNKFTASK